MADDPIGRLYKLSDTDLDLLNRADDIRGRKVIDSNGEEIGTVHDLLVDKAERTVRFIVVSEGGFLGMGTTKFLIPSEAIVRVTAGKVRVDRDRDQVAAAPNYDPALVDQAYLARLYDYYGYRPEPKIDYGGPGYLRF